MRPGQDNLRIRLAPSQKQALRDEAEKRNVSVSELLRSLIAAATGHADEFPKRKPRSNDTRWLET
jgi:hypothetical protein